MGINQKTLPGILLCAILAIPCWLLGQQFHLVGSPIFAIILGIIIGSIFTIMETGKNRCWALGLHPKRFYNGPLFCWALVLTLHRFYM